MSAESSAPPRAYSYLRFSTPEQQKGDSFRRQTALAQTYAEAKGLVLDDSLAFHDVGVSAYRGANVATGKLGAFVAAVEAGEVPSGSYLLVESLDRISRQNVLEAQMLLSRIILGGVTVVTLMDGKEYSEQIVRNDGMALLYAVILFMRANEESATKGRRLKASWEAKRAAIGSKPLTARVPAWLRLNTQTQQFELIPERAAVVRRVYELSLAGWGQNRIAEAFNREGLATWSGGTHWHRTYIAKILRNPAVVGTFVPGTVDYEDKRKVRRALEPVPNYFPPAVPVALWREVEALHSLAHAPSRGRHVRSGINNVLAGLAVCPACGSTATRVSKGARSVPAYVCVKAKAGAGCTYKSVRCELIEAAVFERLPARLANIPAGQEGAIDNDLLSLEEQADDLREQIALAVENLTVSRSHALAAKIGRLERELEALMAARKSLLQRRSAASGPAVARRAQTLLAALQKPSDTAVVNQAMRSLFDKAVIDYVTGDLVLHWTHGGTCEVPFASGFSAIN